MRERPILFQGAMVRALLAGTKTQTRRVCKAAELFDGTEYRDDDGWPLTYDEGTDSEIRAGTPYGHAGDRLWVREAWQTVATYDDLPPRELPQTAPVRYLADDGTRDGIRARSWGKTRPPMFMPRWMCRTELQLTEVRVQRLQDISEADAWAEGCTRGLPDEVGGFFPAEEPDPSGIGARGWDNAVDWYADLWESINGSGSWEANPWVWAVSFTRLQP